MPASLKRLIEMTGQKRRYPNPAFHLLDPVTGREAFMLFSELHLMSSLLLSTAGGVWALVLVSFTAVMVPAGWCPPNRS